MRKLNYSKLKLVPRPPTLKLADAKPQLIDGRLEPQFYNVFKDSDHAYYCFKRLLSAPHLFWFLVFTRSRFVYGLCESADLAVTRGDPIAAAYYLRSVLENTAYFCAAFDSLQTSISKTITKFSSPEKPMIRSNSFLNDSDEYFEDFEQINELYCQLMRELVPLTLDAGGLGKFDFESRESGEPDFYKELKPERIMGKLKLLEKSNQSEIQGLHLAYNILSEIIHPNSLGFFGSASCTNSSNDSLNYLELIPEGVPSDTIFDVFQLDNCFAVVQRCIDLIVQRASEMPQIRDRLARSLRKVIRPALRSEPFKELLESFGKRSCPCLSGKQFSKCCGK